MGALSTRLRTRLVLLALIVVVPAVAVIAYDQSGERRRARERAVDDALTLARLAAVQQAAAFETAQRLLLTLSEIPSIRDADPVICPAILARVRRERQYANLWVVNGDGSATTCSAVPFDPTRTSVPRTWFEHTVRSHRPSIGDYQIGLTTGKPDVVVTQPMLGPSGQLERILAAGIELDQLDAVVAATPLQPGMTVTLADRNGTILARYPHGATWVGHRQPQALLDARRRQASESARMVDAVGEDGERRLHAILPVATSLDTGLYIAIGVELTAIVAEADDLLRLHLWLLGIVTMVTVAFGLVGGQVFVLRPLESLTTVTDRIADGDFQARAQLAAGVPGLGDLGRAVNSMAAALEDRYLDHKRSERALRLSEERFRLISETIAEVFWIADPAIQQMTYVSPGYERVWGRSCASLYENPRSFIDAIHPDDRARVLADLGVQGRGLPFDHEYRIVRPDGDIRWVWDRGFPVPSSDGQVRQYVGAASDITERREAEHARRDAEERMRFALTSSRLGVWEADLKAGATYWSEICEAMHGLQPGTFGRTFEAFIERVHPEDRDALRAEIARAVRDHEDAELHYRTIWPDGTERYVTATAHFFYDEAGVPERGAGVAMDVTERRSLEEQLRQAQKMEAVGQLAGGVAHDFNNMLTAIIGNADFVREELPPNDPRARYVDEIMVAGRGAAALTRQLLAFSRRQVLMPRVLHLGDVVSEVTPMLRRLLGEAVDLQTVVRDHGHVKADAGQLQQVIMNLTVNARDAMPDGGRLTVETNDVTLGQAYARQHGIRPGPYVMVAVSDTGHGMDAATQRRVFEPFFTTKPVGQGTGLGLATVHGIVKQSEGHVSVYSEVGQGTTFKVYLPRTDEAEGAAMATAPESSRDLRGQETILLVEDERAVRAFVQDAITRLGYTVHVRATAELAIEFARSYRGPLHAIVTDVVLPDMNGRTMAARVKVEHPEAKVLFMSGYSDNAIVQHGVLEPGTWFLQKPFTPHALGEKLRDVLTSASATA